MIVRIAGEDQYRIADDLLEELNRLDNACVATVDGADEPGFHATYDAMLAFVREHGTRLDDDELVGSEVILPPADLTFEEAGAQFNGDGLIPE